MNRTTDTMEIDDMNKTDMQSKLADLYARLDELGRMKDYTTDRETLERIAEREKALREAIDRTLNA